MNSLLASPRSVWVETSPVRRERWVLPQLRAPPPLWSPIDSSAASRPERTDQLSYYVTPEGGCRLEYA